MVILNEKQDELDDESSRKGELHLILGPMFSGKTTKLIEYSQKYENKVIINYAGDTRYHPTLLSTHDQIMTPCIQTYELTALFCHKEVISAEAIFINEGQFFGDLFDTVVKWVDEEGKRVFVCGLDGDFQRKPIGDIHLLISLCDTLEKLRARCSLCSLPAPFTWRTSSEQSQIMIGSDEYIPLCRGCYLGSLTSF